MNLPTASPLVVIGLTLLAVVIFNGYLILRVRHRAKMKDDVKMMKTVIDSARTPWKRSEQEYDELAELVKKAQQTTPKEDSQK